MKDQGQRVISAQWPEHANHVLIVPAEMICRMREILLESICS
jgi:hypothetical protein